MKCYVIFYMIHFSWPQRDIRIAMVVVYSKCLPIIQMHWMAVHSGHSGHVDLPSFMYLRISCSVGTGGKNSGITSK